MSAEGDEESNYGFTGEWTDATGLQHLRARYYNTNVGRFTTKDVWPGDYTQPMTLNGWMYVNGNPVNWVDPSGLCYVDSPFGGYMVSGACDAAHGPSGSVTRDDIPRLRNSNANVPLREKIRERRKNKNKLIVGNPPGVYYPTSNLTDSGPLGTVIDQLTQGDLDPQCLFGAVQDFCNLNSNDTWCQQKRGEDKPPPPDDGEHLTPE